MSCEMTCDEVASYGNNPLACCLPIVCCCGAPVLVACLFIPKVGLWIMCAALAVILLYVFVMIVKSVLAVEVHGAEDAASILYNFNHNTTEGLPDKLRGVFWMSTNAAPELLASIDGSYWDEERRMINLDAGSTYNRGPTVIMRWAGCIGSLCV
mmetsp:Transcript_130499/g.260401  ORF Transcript_130499/g.260401 Transcript_130499/m.260401 type:complete len:154 (-) Transcript_130499:637-1098(-)